MPVSALHVDLRFDEDLTARQRRQLLFGIVQHLRQQFNVAVSEIGPSAPNICMTLGVATVARTRQEARATLVHVADALDGHPHAEVVHRRFDDFP